MPDSIHENTCRGRSAEPVEPMWCLRFHVWPSCSGTPSCSAPGLCGSVGLSPVNGLRVSLAVTDENVVVTFKNVQENRELFLLLGDTVGVGRANLVQLHLIRSDGDRQWLRYTGGSGVAPGRITPYIVPMMAGSTYSVRTPLGLWEWGTLCGGSARNFRAGPRCKPVSQ